MGFNDRERCTAAAATLILKRERVASRDSSSYIKYHAQVQEVVGIMRGNVERVLERDQKLSQLDDRADALQQGASQFESQAAKLKRKYWWRNIKMWIILGIVAAVVIIIIAVSISSGKKNDEDDPNP